MRLVVAGGLALALAACAGTPDVEVTALADGRFLYATTAAGELPEPDVMGAAIEAGEARCQKDGKMAQLDSATVTRDGKQFDEHFYTCVAP